MPSRADAQSQPPGVNPRFWSLVVGEPLSGVDVVDVGTGAGRIALAVAPSCREVVGIERDAELVAEAERRARHAGLRNARFIVADADALADFCTPAPEVRIAPSLVTAHMFLSDALVTISARSLPVGGALVCAGFHVDHWRETGRASRFAYDESKMTGLLDAAGFAVEHIGVEREVREFRSLEEALAAAVGLEERWRADGRWFRYIEFLERGGRTLTHAILVAKARRR